jgi:DNA polymerase-3 subunit delta'
MDKNGTILPWQKQTWQRLLTQESNNTLPHALLLSGQEGLGKLHFAQNLARLLLCEGRHLTQEPDAACGACKQCRLFEAETHPDLKLIQPEEGSASIKVDQIRNLVEFSAQSSQLCGRKIMILTPAESLNINAANALLKTLEEPGKGSVIMLVSHQPGSLLPTIRSRCQVVDFTAPAGTQSLDWLISELNSEIPPEDITHALELAHQAPLKTLDFLKAGMLTEYKMMLDELAALLKNDKLSSTLSARWSDDMAQLRLSWMMHWLEQLLKLKLGTGAAVLFHGELMFKYLAGKSTVRQLFELYTQCLKQYQLFMSSSNPNKALAFEYLLHHWSVLMRKV